jgi:hypothetical protein
MIQNVLIVVVIVLILGVVVVGNLVGQRRVAQFEQACRDRGWQVERGTGRAFDQQISGTTSGIDWQYEYYRYQRGSSTGSATSTSETRFGRWQCTSPALPGQVVLILPAGGQSGQFGTMLKSMDSFGGIGRMMLELFVVKGLRGEPSDVDLFMHLKEAQAGSEPFRAQYTVMSTDAEAAAKLLRHGEMALMDYGMNPALKPAQRRTGVLLWSKGLMLPVERLITDIALMDALVTLGAALANSVKGW